MNEYLLKKATPEQLAHYGRQSQRVQAIKRLMSEPPLYRPVRNFYGYILAVSFQLNNPVETEIQLFNTGRCDSFRAIINGKKQPGRGGWYHYGNVLAESMPRRIIQE